MFVFVFVFATAYSWCFECIQICPPYVKHVYVMYVGVNVTWFDSLVGDGSWNFMVVLLPQAKHVAIACGE